MKSTILIWYKIILTVFFVQTFRISIFCDGQIIHEPNTIRTLLSQSVNVHVSPTKQSLRDAFINDVINAITENALEKYLKYGTSFLNSLSESNQIQFSPLIVAIRHANWISFNFLIKDGANVNYGSPISAITPLKFAMLPYREKFLKALVRHEKINLNEQNNSNLETPLIFAIRTKTFSDATIILQNEHVDVTIKDVNNQNALHHTCVQNWKDGINRIIFHESSDESLFETDSNMMTPLLLAAKFASFEMIETLLKHKKLAQTVNLANGDGVTPLIQAVMIGGARKDAQTRFKAEVLIEAGAEVDAKDNKGWTALTYAFATNKSVTAQQVLIANGADVNMKDESGQTYLHLAATNNWLDAVNILAKQDNDQGYIDVDVQDGDGRTPLMLACLHGHEQMRDLLLEKGANGTKTDNNGTAGWIYLLRLRMRQKVIGVI